MLPGYTLRTFYVTDGQNRRDHITSDSRSKRARSKFNPYIFSAGPNEWRRMRKNKLGLRAPLAARNKEFFLWEAQCSPISPA